VIRSIIVDDEDLARERIRTLLGGHYDVEVVAEYARGADALREIASVRPDLMFLDISMPGIDGFSLLEALPLEHRPPAVIFVTAYDEHAIRAFDVNAIDYLLKPFTRERFDSAIERVRRSNAVPGPAYRQRMDAALETIRKSKRERIAVKSEYGTSFLAVADVDWAESSGNYVLVHSRGATTAVRETLNRLAARLPQDRFLRVHRSIVVNLERIVRIEPWTHGEHVIVLRDGTKLKSGRSYSEALRALLS
jgi:two-component system LytT family response regulator